MLYNYIVKGYNKAEIIGDIEDKIFSNIAEYDDEIADICERLFEIDEYNQLKQLNNFLADVLNELREREYTDSIIHYIYYNDIEYVIERSCNVWIMDNQRFDSLIEILESLATF